MEDEGVGTIHLLEPGGDVLRLETRHGFDTDRLPREQHVSAGKGVTSWVALRKQPVLIEKLDAPKAKAFRAIHDSCRDGIQCELAVPMWDAGKLLGVLNLQSLRPDVFHWESVGLLLHAATGAALAFRLAEQTERAKLTLEILKICSDAPARALQPP